MLQDSDGEPLALVVNSQSYKGSHFATMPELLVEPLILAGSSPRCCENCGAPWRRMIDKESPPASVYAKNGKPESIAAVSHPDLGKAAMGQKLQDWYNEHPAQTIGWTPTCLCPPEKNTGSGRCIILDPFSGSGTVMRVAAKHGRRGVGIDLNPDYHELAKERTTVQMQMQE